MFQGTIVNVAVLKQQYGLSKGANEVNIIIEAYRTLRDRGPYPADQVVRDISGKFAFVLYDCSTKSVFMAAVSELLLYFTFFFGCSCHHSHLMSRQFINKLVNGGILFKKI
jgi:hypothetical protein